MTVTKNKGLYWYTSQAIGLAGFAAVAEPAGPPAAVGSAGLHAAAVPATPGDVENLIRAARSLDRGRREAVSLVRTIDRVGFHMVLAAEGLEHASSSSDIEVTPQDLVRTAVAAVEERTVGNGSAFSASTWSVRTAVESGSAKTKRKIKRKRCIESWGASYATNLSLLIILQKRVIRIIK